MLAERGMSVALVSPSLTTPWTNQYASWADELVEVGLGHCLAPVWPKARVRVDSHRSILVDRAFGRIDGALLEASLADRGRSAGLHRVDGRVLDVEHRPDGISRVSFDDGQLDADLFVDATGHWPQHVQREPGRATAFQSAYGITCTATCPLPTDEMLLMDWIPLPAHLEASWDGPPTFLYAMPLGEDRWFFEETVLTAQPPVAVRRLRDRLYGRLAAMGVVVHAVEHVERCWIPMNSPRPLLSQRSGAFGGAASMVHPATGFMVGYCARKAPALVDAICRELARPDRTRPASRAVWETLWSSETLSTDLLYRFGAEALLRFSPDEVRDFFWAFFGLPDPMRHRYLRRDLGPSELRAAMWGVYRSLAPSRRRLLRSAAYAQPSLLARALFGLRMEPRAPRPALPAS
jgi:lycopene cyclase-like protein